MATTEFCKSMPTDKMKLLPTTSEGWGKVMFSVCSHWGEGVPQPGPDGTGSTYPPAKVGTPQPDQDGGRVYPKAPTLPQPRYSPSHVRMGEGYPKVGIPLSQVRMGGGGTQRYLPPGQGRNPSPSQVRTGERGGTPWYLPPTTKLGTPPGQVRMGEGVPQSTYPLPQDRAADGVLHTLRSVCLLLLRRRTFLSSLSLESKFQGD